MGKNFLEVIICVSVFYVILKVSLVYEESRSVPSPWAVGSDERAACRAFFVGYGTYCLFFWLSEAVDSMYVLK